MSVGCVRQARPHALRRAPPVPPGAPGPPPAAAARRRRHCADQVFVSSPSVVYISTSSTATFYSDNDEIYSSLRTYQNLDVIFKIVKDPRLRRQDLAGLAVFKALDLNDGDSTETQEATILIDTDSSDREHLYESLSHPPRTVDVRTGTGTAPYADDFDSFDSDSETEDRSFHHVQKNDIDINNAQLPEPPTSSNIYTLTRFASAAGKKMRQLKSFTTFTKSTRKKSTGEAAKCNLGTENKDSKQVPDKKNKKQTFKEGNKSLPDIPSQNLNTSFSRLDENNTEKLRVGKDSPNIKQPSPLRENLGFQFPSKNSLYNNTTSPSVVKRNLATEDETVSPDSNKNAKASPTNNGKEKDSGTLSRKSYLSFKSKFKRNTSLIETNPTRSLSLSVTKSTFYLNDLNDSAVHKSEPQLTYESNKDEPPPLPASKKMTNNSSQDLQATDLGVKSNSESSIDVNSNKTSPVNETRSIAPSKFVKNRPAGPPPPPPLESNHINTDLKKQQSNKKDKRTLSTTSWYAECGLFKASEPYKPESNGQVKERKSSASWYSEVGLYQVGNISTSSGASSTLSGGGTCSTTTAPSPPDTPVPPLGMFNQEPLYQFYNAAKLESVCRDIGKDSDMESDVYEEVANFKEGSNGKIVQRPSAMALINPQKGPSRTLWCEIPEVINSAILGSLAPTQKKLQEAMFEIITSEASYLNSLTVLESHFMQHPAFKDDKILSESDGNILFGNVIPVKKCSEQLMADLEQCWQDNILLRGLCKIVKKHAEKNFHVYVKYCEYQVYIIKTLKKLKTDDKFNEVLLQIQSQPACHSLSLHSFLMLPMQRVTRLPLLMDAVLKNLDASEDEYQSCLDALAILNNIVFQCNEGARNMERVEEMAQLSSKFEFPPYVKEVPIILPKSDHKIIDKPQRWLVKSGELTQLVWRGDDQSKLTFGKKYNKISLHLFLFTDLLVITKKKSEDSFIVVDYCKRSLLEITSSDMMGQSPVKETAGRHVLLLTMLENCENKTIEMLLSCVSESDRQRWIEACLPPPSDNPNETIYEGWDCPQVAAIYPYQSTQPDELNLQQGDIVNVSKKMADGWYHGERIRDGEKGWFPGNYTIEIASQHVRAKNLRQRYRLLALTGSYLEKNKKK